MNPKSVVLLVAGVIIISSLFTAFHVAYPSGNPIIPKIPKQINQLKLFSLQTTDHNLLGAGKTSFTPSGNSTITIQGYASNATANSWLGNQQLFSAVFPVETSTFTSSNGYYKITVLLSGNGTFAFKIPGYNPIYKSLDLFGVNNVWENLSFTPEAKYQVSGETVFPSGNMVPDANIVFNGLFGTYNVTSGSSGKYSISLYNDTYLISAIKQGFSNQVTPDMINVTGTPLRNLTLTLHPYGNAIYNVSGYVFNEMHQPISGAMVSTNTSPDVSVTNSTGFYKVGVAYGSNAIEAIASGYMPNIPPLSVFVVGNLTDQNITLQNSNPFSGFGSGTGTGQGFNGLNGSSIKNITKQLGNSTSSSYNGTYPNGTSSNGSSSNMSNISYGNGNPPGGIVVYGNITNSNNSLPVFNTNLRFYINVNGTYFYESVATNGTGYYQIYLADNGSYHFAVFSPFYYVKNLSVIVDGNTSESFSMTPLPGYMFTVSGIVFNSVDSLPVQATIQLDTEPSNSPINFTHTNSAGMYSLRVMEGNFSLTASAPGYIPETFNISVIKNETLNFSLQPSASIGNGIQKWSGSSGTNLPGGNGTSISQALNSTGPGNATGYKVVNLTVTLYNKTSKATLGNMAFEAFIKIDGAMYNYTGYTNQSGMSVITLFYTGNYTILVDSVYYNGTPKKLDITGDMSTSFNLTPRPVYSLEVTMYNDYPGIGSTDHSVPASTLTVNNYQSMGITYSSYLKTSQGTVYSYYLPNGTYNFAYSNVNFVPAVFSYTLSGLDSSTTQNATPYLASVYVNSAVNWNLSLAGPISKHQSGLAGSSSFSLYLTKGSYVSFFNMSESKSINQTVGIESFSLSTTHSLENLYFNLTSSSKNITSNGIPLLPNPNYMNVTFNFTNPGFVWVYKMALNYSVQSGSKLILNGADFAMNSSNLSFLPYYETNGANMNMLFEIIPTYSNGYALIPTWPLNLTVSYYAGSAGQSNFGVGT